MPLLGKGPEKLRGDKIRYIVKTDAVSLDEACSAVPDQCDFKSAFWARIPPPVIHTYSSIAANGMRTSHIWQQVLYKLLVGLVHFCCLTLLLSYI